MTILLSIAIFQALFLVLLLVNKKDKEQSDTFLILLIVFMAYQQAIFLVNFHPIEGIPDWLMLIGAGFPLLSGPILYFYVSSLIREGRLKPGLVALHLAPYVLFEILVFVIRYVVPDATAEFIDGYVQFHGNIPGAVYWYGAAFAVSGFIYPVYCLWLLRKHANTIRERFSYTEKISLNWLRLLILGALLSFIIGFVAFELIIGNSISEPRNAFYIIATVNTVFIFVLGYFGLRQPHIFVTQPEQPRQAKEKYMHSGLNPKESDRIIRDLNKFMQDERPYLDPKLTLAGLANQLGTSANRLSQVLNSELGLTFYDFINDYRIEEVKQQLINPDRSHITLLGIALDAGFNSKSSFNKLFKEKTGQTPSEFKKEMYKSSGRA